MGSRCASPDPGSAGAELSRPGQEQGGAATGDDGEARGDQAPGGCAGGAHPFGKPGWWQDWTGCIAVIVGAGPSVKQCPVAEATGAAPGRIKTVVVNTSYQICGNADVLYACDGGWWRSHKGCPAFAGLKITQDRGAAQRYHDVHKIKCRPRSDQLLFDKPGEVGWGGNGGFQALNLALQFGATKVILVGFDMTLQQGVHWHGRHPSGLSNPKSGSVDRWRQVLDAQAPLLSQMGIDVVIGSPGSSLTAFRKLGLWEAIDEFHRALFGSAVPRLPG